ECAFVFHAQVLGNRSGGALPVLSFSTSCTGELSDQGLETWNNITDSPLGREIRRGNNKRYSFEQTFTL
ncbi:unnamed protein product, partial [Closterium sp. Naga37s-1]